VEPFELGPLFTNCFLVWDDQEKWGVIVDPADDPLPVNEYCKEHGISVELILATHGHFDHIAGTAEAKRIWDVPFAISSLDEMHYQNAAIQAQIFGCPPIESIPDPDIDLADVSEVSSDHARFDVIPTPGHSKGSVTFRLDNHLLVGDLIFQGSIGRTDMPGGSMEELVTSVQTEIFTVPDGLIYPGHGPVTAVETEKQSNPFF
jgi:glyoxylase-like metal-dependent hydrolase (beta-lactamase superfamily II)